MLQESRQKARAERIAAIREGKAKSARTPELKAVAKGFAGQMRADSDYTGEDYEVFAKWLSQGHGEGTGEEDAEAADGDALLVAREPGDE